MRRQMRQDNRRTSAVGSLILDLDSRYFQQQRGLLLKEGVFLIACAVLTPDDPHNRQFRHISTLRPCLSFVLYEKVMSAQSVFR